jgi:hypothetical protein
MAFDNMSPEQRTETNSQLKNLHFYIHQNFLVVVQIILSRMARKKSNVFGVLLDKVLDSKMLKKVTTKGEAIQMMKVHCQNSENILRGMIKQNSKKKLFALIGDWLVQIHNLPNERLREVLYNVEQFRADSVQIQEPKPKPQNKRSPSKSLSASTKTSGTTNLVAGSGSSVTGKNPFAILKASAIASTSSAIFPNNFTNLPKVFPPFLPPLEGEDKLKIYTLVLDLDETLIHNVEVSLMPNCLVRSRQLLPGPAWLRSVY